MHNQNTIRKLKNNKWGQIGSFTGALFLSASTWAVAAPVNAEQPTEAPVLLRGGGGGHGGGHGGGGGGHVGGGGRPPGGGGHSGGGHVGGGHVGGGGKPGGGHAGGGGKPGGGHVGGGGKPGGGNPGGGHAGGGGKPGGGSPGGGHAGGGKPGGGGHAGGGTPGGGHAGGGHHGGHTGKPVGVNPGHNITKSNPSKTVSHTRLSHYDNRHTQSNLNAAHVWGKRVAYSSTVNNRLTLSKNNYYSTHNTFLKNRYNVCGSYYRNNSYRYYYSSWFNRGFCGGYYYPVHPYYNVNTYFYYPMVYWLYVGTVDTDYYRTWYGSDYESCPISKAFPYARAFFPTQQIVDLGMEVSGLTAARQCNFRIAMYNMTKSIVDQASTMAGVSIVLGDSDIVVNHYENLTNTAFVLEGFLNNGTINLPFKAVLDLVTPANTLVFIPKNQEPTNEELNNLDKVNTIIKDNGGDPTQVDDEPDSLVAPPPKS